MIKIKELVPPRKLSGLSSFSVSFNYNEQLVNLVKTFVPAIYDKKTHEWEVASNYLSKMLDSFVYFDDIELQLAKDEIKEISKNSLTEIEKVSFKEKPYEHQLDAVNFGLQHPKWLLLDSMGVGKSFEAICLAETLHSRGLIDHCLVICGVDSLRQNWKKEIQKFSKESVVVLGEKLTKTGKVRYKTLAERAEQLINTISEFFVVVNITNIRDDKFIEAFKKSKNNFGLILFDEAHRASKKSQQGQNLLKLDSDYKVAMTGTPIVNSPISAYLALSWTDNDQATLTNFKAQYCNFGGFNNSQIVGYKNLDLLKEEIEACSLRRTFDQVRGDMPKKNIEYEVVEMSDEHQKFYEAIKNGVKEEADKVELKTNNLLALCTRLRQATAAPSVLTSESIESSKVERAVELAEDLLEAGEKVIIMSAFKEPVYTIAKKLEKFKPLVCTGDQAESLISQSIDSFRNSSDYNIIIGTESKIGTGFSMPECRYMIFIDQPWTQALFAQCCDRIYRITSNSPIFVKVLVCKDTIDERVRQIVENKKELSDYMIDNVDNDFAKELINIIFEN